MLNFLLLVGVFIYFIYRINELEVKVKKLQSPVEEKPKTPAALPMAVPPKPEPIVAQPISAPTPAAPTDWEGKIGGKVFTIVGAVAVIFGISFFLKYAFDHNLISESARVMLGILAGIVIITIGQLNEKKYALYGQLLTGLGLGVCYLTIFAAFNYYHLVSQPGAFAAMIAVTALGIILSVKSNSQALAGFSQFGGFITPLLLSNGVNNPHGLFGYILVLDAVIIILSLYKPWQALNLGSLIGTFIIYASWFAFNYTDAQFSIAFGYISLFFLLFLAVSLIQYFVQKSGSSQKTLALLTFNAIFYYIVSYTVMNSLHHSWMGPFTFGLAALYLILGLLTLQRQNDLDYFNNFLLGISFIFFFVAIPIQFHKYVISIGWGAEALVLILIGFQMRNRNIRYTGHFIFLATSVHLFFNAALVNVDSAWINTRTISTAMVAVCMLAAAYVYWLRKSEIETSIQQSAGFAPKNEFMEAITALVLQAYLIIFWVVSLEIYDFHQMYWLPITWSVLALLLGIIGLSINNKTLRTTSQLTFGLVVCRLLFYDSSVNINTYTPVLNARVGAFLVAIMAISLLLYMLHKHDSILSPNEKGLALPGWFFGSNILMLWLISFEVLDFFNQQGALSTSGSSQFYNIKNASLSVAWILYAIIILIAGIIAKNLPARLFAFVLFGIVIVKVFLYDTINLNNLYRFISYITLGIILLLAGYLYNRYKDRIIHFIKASD